jgi:hypothetical protein
MDTIQMQIRAKSSSISQPESVPLQRSEPARKLSGVRVCTMLAPFTKENGAS